MKTPLILTAIVLSTKSVLAVPPPQGKSLRSDGNYQSIDVPTGSLLDATLDLPNRIESRVKKVQELKRKEEKHTLSKVRAKSRPQKDSIQISQAVPLREPEKTNLPNYYQGIDRSLMKASDLVVFVPSKGNVKLKGVKSGDIIHAIIEQEIKASPSVPTPIRAVAVSSLYKGAFLLGEATLDRELKRVLFQFTKLRLPDSEQVYGLKASGLSPVGSIGLEGEYHSQTGKFFLAEFASATAAGVVDATINRSQTAFGGYVQEPSLGNASKQGVVTALSRTADRMAENARQAPEYTQVQGFQEIQIIIQDEPVEID